MFFVEGRTQNGCTSFAHFYWARVAGPRQGLGLGIVRNAVESGSKFRVGPSKKGKKRTVSLASFLADELTELCAVKSLA